MSSIACGLNFIHCEGILHRDFHSGNILNSDDKSWIADLGLSQPINYQLEEGEIFGVLPYVAPEVLSGQPYSQASDIYSFGIIAYELLANSYPYPEMDDLDLVLKVCQEYRPNVNELKIPLLLKDLINRCWDADPQKRPSTENLWNIFYNWREEIKDKRNSEFYQQYQEIEEEYNTFSQNTPYQIYSNAALTSKVINTKQITNLLQSIQRSIQGDSKQIDLDLNNFNLDKLIIQEDSQEQSSYQAKIETSPK